MEQNETAGMPECNRPGVEQEVSNSIVISFARAIISYRNLVVMTSAFVIKKAVTSAIFAQQNIGVENLLF